MDKLKTTIAHRDADARQRHRHQLLRGRQGAQLATCKHRPVGLGIMGFQDCLHMLRMPYASRGGGGVRRPLDGSGLLPRLLGLDRARRGARPLLDLRRLAVGPRHPAAGHARAAGARSAAATSKSTASATLDWDALRARIAQHGMRNSNCVAIAPTATISNIIGVVASIEPTYQNLYVKSNLSGEFTVVNEYLVRDLKGRPVGRGDGRRPQVLRRLAARRSTACRPELRELYATAFEVEPQWLVECRGAPPEVDRPGAVAQHLHGGRLGQEARRDLQARLAARPEDHLLPAHARRDARREVDGRSRASSTRCRAARAPAIAAATPRRRDAQRRSDDDAASDVKFCALDDPDCEACQ